MTVDREEAFELPMAAEVWRAMILMALKENIHLEQKLKIARNGIHTHDLVPPAADQPAEARLQALSDDLDRWLISLENSVELGLVTHARLLALLTPTRRKL